MTTQRHKSELRYIPEIDALRALAVLPVLFYHLGFAWIPGGFLGVDVFFVISGYLISTILFAESSKPTLRYFLDFYLRRLRRLFPAFFLVIAVTLATGYFLLLPEDYAELALSGAAAVGFVSNLFFYFNTGYFDGPAESMPLLHTWSLAVEEQFYLVWPALVFLLARSCLRRRLVVIGVLFLLSLGLSVMTTSIDPSLAFFNFPFRIFQFLCGALVAVVARDDVYFSGWPARTALVVQGAGLVFIAYAYFAFSADDAMPGWRALVPSLGAALFILGVMAREVGSGRGLLQDGILVFIGKISYSLYLWHWPLITYYRVWLGGESLALVDAFWLFGGTLVLSLLSYELVENRFRRPTWQRSANWLSGALAATVVVSSLGVLHTDGVRSRVPDATKIASRGVMWRWDCPREVDLGLKEVQCNFGVSWRDARTRIVLWGDSHAEQLVPLLEDLAKTYHLSFVVFPSCRPVTDGERVFIRHRNPERATAGCHAATERMLEVLETDERIALVVLAGAWSYSPKQLYSEALHEPGPAAQLDLFAQGLEGTVRRVIESGSDVLLMGDTPMSGTARRECAAHNPLWRKNAPDCASIPLAEVASNQEETERVLESIAGRLEGVVFHSIIAHHCREGACPTFSHGEYIYRDDNHIRRNISEAMRHDLIASFGLDQATDWQKYAAPIARARIARNDES